MNKPNYEQGLQLQSNFLDLMRTVDHDGAQRLIQNFNLVHAIASGLVHAIAGGEVKIVAPMPLKPIVSGVSIPEAPAVKIADCFKVGDGVYAYRDSDFDRWLPQTFPAVGPGNASMFELLKELTFQEMAEAHFGITGSPDKLKKALIGQGKCWSPKQVDEFVRRSEKGDNPLKLRIDGYANLFFIEVNGAVFAVRALRHSDGWLVRILEFAGASRWFVGHRVSFRN